MIPALHPVKNDPQLLQIRFMLQQFENTIAPEWVQRPIAWNNHDKKSYFKSILMNRTEGSFVFVDLAASIDAMEKHNCTGDRAYPIFQGLLSHADWLTLDGNNRFTFISELINNDYKIPKGTYQVVIKDCVIEFGVGSKQTFDDLPAMVKKIILERICVAVTYTQVTYESLAEIFLNLNSGCPLNRQEKRNAFLTDYSEYFRNLRKELAPLLMRVVGSKYKTRLAGDEWLVNAVYYSMINEDCMGGVSQGKLDTFYRSDINDVDTEMITVQFLQLQDVLAGMDDKFMNKGMVYNYFWALRNGLPIERLPQFVERHFECYNDKGLTNDQGDTFKWACGGMGDKNNHLKIPVMRELMASLV